MYPHLLSSCYGVTLCVCSPDFVRRELGQGTFGRVFECAELFPSSECAAPRILGTEVKKTEQQSLVAVKVLVSCATSSD